MRTEVLSPGNYYHIYNRGNNGEPLFFEEENYIYFLKLYDKYISPIAETYAWCLMKNHFHFLVYLKSEEEIDISQLTYKTSTKPKIISASRQFSHCFNSYAQTINKKYNRTGSLFEKSLERKHVKNENYFLKLIYYIHNNPVHHGVSDSISNYRWSSYKSFLLTKPTKLKRKEVLELFEGLENFIFYHNHIQNLGEINNLIFE